jgi:hypothetical protein
MLLLVSKEAGRVQRVRVGPVYIFIMAEGGFERV